MVVKCTSAGQYTEQWTIGELLLLEKSLCLGLKIVENKWGLLHYLRVN